jgi:hypothetical protein
VNRNTPEPTDSRSLEQALIDRLGDLERQIAELSRDHEATKRLLTKVRRESLDRHEVTRKDSFGRIVVENKIIEILRSHHRSMRGSDILRRLSNEYVDIKASTFRSYLRRMKEKGIVVEAKIVKNGHDCIVVGEVELSPTFKLR